MLWFRRNGMFGEFMSSCVDITDFKRCQVALQAKHEDLECLMQDRTNALSVTNARLQEE